MAQRKTAASPIAQLDCTALLHATACAIGATAVAGLASGLEFGIALELAPRVVPITRRVEPEALLQARVPASLVDAVKLLAAQIKIGWTVRRVRLEALKSYGITVPDDALCDRRK